MDQLLKNAAEDNLAKRVLAFRHLLDFTTFTKPDYRAHAHHKILAAKLDGIADKKFKRLMIFMPPQHGKSELVSRRFPAFMLGKHPELRLIACSHTNELAERMNLDVRRIMMSESFRQVFDKVRIGPRRVGAVLDAQCKLGLVEIAGHRGSLRSAGVGKAIAGMPADGAIIDDPFGKREDADSPLIRQKIWDWYTNDLHTRLAAGGWIVLTHTRWHRDDLAGRLLKKMADRGADQWEVLCLPAIKEENGGEEASPHLPVSPSLLLAADKEEETVLQDERLPGEALWPEFKSVEELETIRRQDARAFAALYQQNPTDGAAVEWAAEFFGDWMWVPPEEWPKKFKMGVVCVDASKGRADRPGDYCAIVFLGVGYDALIYVDALIDRFPLDQIVRKTILFCDERRPDYVGIEADQFQELLLHEFDRQMAARGPVTWPLYAMRTMGIPKVARIRSLSRYIVHREFRFKADSPGCRLLVDQLMDFPNAEHDDGPDALEMCTRLPNEAVL
jgi:predicted phage terminase large subunit-like protein